MSATRMSNRPLNSRPSLSNSRERAATILAVCLIASCQPSVSTPVPKQGFNTEKIDYDRTHPEAKIVSLGDIVLDEKREALTSRGMISTLPIGEMVAVEGTIVHPDKRFEACAVIIRLTRADGKNAEKLVYEQSKLAKGKRGQLKFRIETRVPRVEPGPCKLTVYVETYQPGQDIKGTPQLWNLDACVGEVTLK